MHQQVLTTWRIKPVLPKHGNTQNQVLTGLVASAIAIALNSLGYLTSHA